MKSPGVTKRDSPALATEDCSYYQLQPFDATSIFDPAAPPGTFTIDVTPQQAAFLQTPGLPNAVAQQYAFLAGGHRASHWPERTRRRSVAGGSGRDPNAFQWHQPPYAIPQFLQLS